MQIKYIFIWKAFHEDSFQIKLLVKPGAQSNAAHDHKVLCSQFLRRKDQRNLNGCQAADSVISMQIFLRIISSNFALWKHLMATTISVC